MSIKYNIIARGRPDHAEVPKKYYPSLQSTGEVTLRELATEASDISTLSTADMMAHLAKGKVVDSGDFGSFWLRLRREWKTPPG